MSYICKLEGKYFEYSSVSDSVETDPMTLEEFRAMYLDYMAKEVERELDERLARVENNGTSHMRRESFEEIIVCDRSGKNETRLDLEHFKAWCRGEVKDLREIEGQRHDDGEDDQ